ncbi:MAG TPA: hypothetical protein ENO14_04170 [Chromatiales bacterium]|nr:hypothetical protein [Chromatiales bacterium]
MSLTRSLSAGLLIFGTIGLPHLPMDLQRIATELDCRPVDGFFERPGMVNPPYVYGVLPGEAERSAAFWCQIDAFPKYRLVIVEDREVRAAIEWSNFPGGLSIAEEIQWPLSEFHFLDEPHVTGPSGEVTRFPPIRSEYDGAVELFYEYNGRWLVRMID